MTLHRSHAWMPARLLTAFAVVLSMLFASVGSVGADIPTMSTQPPALSMSAQLDVSGMREHVRDGDHAPSMTVYRSGASPPSQPAQRSRKESRILRRNMAAIEKLR